MSTIPPPAHRTVDKRSLAFLLVIFALLGVILLRLTYIQVFKAQEIVQRAGPSASRNVSYSPSAPEEKVRRASSPSSQPMTLTSRIWRKVKHLFQRLRNSRITASRAVSHRASLTERSTIGTSECL